MTVLFTAIVKYSDVISPTVYPSLSSMFHGNQRAKKINGHSLSM